MAITPLPWKTVFADDTSIINSYYQEIASTYFDKDDYAVNYERREADAAFIVNACNAYEALTARVKALEKALAYYADPDCWARIVVPSRGSHAAYDIEDDFWRWEGDNDPTATAREALSAGSADVSYSTQAHIAHDIRMGRFPKRSSRELYEAEAFSSDNAGGT